MNGYNFTERMRRILARAREESARLHHEYVGTEHILLGLVAESEGVALDILRNLSVDPASLAVRIEGVVKRGRAAPSRGPDLPYTSRAKTVLELSMRQAQLLKHSYVGSEHLLLGLAAEGKGIAAQVLAEAGVTLDVARAELVRVLGSENSPYHDFGDLKGKSVERVEVILHYPEGRRFHGSFTSPQDAAHFLEWTAPRNRGS